MLNKLGLFVDNHKSLYIQWYFFIILFFKWSGRINWQKRRCSLVKVQSHLLL